MSDEKWLPFRPEFEDALRSGRKRATSRTRAYGSPGDVLDTPVGPVRITGLERLALRLVANLYFGPEGFDTPFEFMRAWEQIHPRRGFRGDDLVWLHWFELANPPPRTP